MRWEGGRPLALIKSEGYRTSLRFHLLVSSVNQGNEGARQVQDFLMCLQGSKDSLQIFRKMLKI